MGYQNGSAEASRFFEFSFLPDPKDLLHLIIVKNCIYNV
jgi:hypothetical protein